MRAGNIEFGADVGVLITLLKVATLIHRPMRDGVADPLDLSPNELRILMTLGGEGAQAGHDLSDMIGLPAMNVSRALGSLGKMGLVEQVRDENNRRRKPYQLSVSGWRAFEATVPRIAAIADFLLGGLSGEDRDALGGLLSRIDTRIAEWHSLEDRPHVPRA